MITEKEAENYCRYVVHEYLENRNYELIFNILDEDSSIIGTGAHEVSRNGREGMMALKNEEQIWDGNFIIEDEWYQANRIVDNIFIVFGEIKAKQNGDDKLVYDFSTRVSIVIRYKNNVWKVLHIHQSMPDYSQGDDEFFPHRLIEKSRSQLEMQIAEKTKELEMSNHQVLFNLKHDYLTSILNRHYLEEEIEKRMEKNKSGVIIVIDVDYFKEVNDNYGHPIGDKVLIKLAETMKENFKLGCCGRIGGDEFVAFLQINNHQDEISNYIMQFVQEWEKNVSELNIQHPVTLSIGVACYPEHGENYHDLWANADKALYISKNNGRNRVSIYKC